MLEYAYGNAINKDIFKVRTTYTMKRELYTMNENSTHKNDDFCKKNTKNTPQIEKC